MKTYTQLVKELYDNPNKFYHILIANTGLLLQTIEAKSQGKVAQDLKMSPTQLSYILKLLKELYYAK